VRDFFSQAKRNIDQLAAELFYEEENEEDDEDEDEEGAGDEAEPAGSEGQKRLTASGDASATPEKAKASALRLTSGSSADGTGAVTPALLSSASQKQLGSPRKTQLLQQLMSLSAHMDEGLSAVSKAKEAAARAAKEASAAPSRSGGGGGGGGGALSYDTRSHANKFNKLDIQALAAMAREDDVASPRKGAAVPGSKGAYPEVSDQTKRTVRRAHACTHARAGGWARECTRASALFDWCATLLCFCSAVCQRAHARPSHSSLVCLLFSFLFICFAATLLFSPCFSSPNLFVGLSCRTAPAPTSCG